MQNAIFKENFGKVIEISNKKTGFEVRNHSNVSESLYCKEKIT